MAKLTYFNIIMLCSLLTAYNMQAADAADVPGAFATTTLNRFVNEAKQAGYLEGMQDALATTRPTFTESLANLKDLAGEELSSIAAAARARLAPYLQGAQERLAPLRAKAEPYTGYISGPASTLASSLARAATATGGAITSGVGAGLEKLTTKAGVQEWLNSAAAQEYLQNNFPDILGTLQQVDRKTYDMILGGVALAVGTYLAGKGLAAGYNYLTAGPTVLRTATTLKPEPKYFARQENETLQGQIERLIEEENNIKLQLNLVRGELKNPVLTNDQKEAFLSIALAYDTELALLSNKINQLRQEEQGFTSGSWRTPGSLEQRIAQVTAARDKAEGEVYGLLLQGKKEASQYAKKIANDLNAQLSQLTAQLPAQPAAQPVAPQPGFFSRMRAKLPSIGMPSMPSWSRRTPVQEGRVFFSVPSTKSYANLSGGLEQLKQAKTELEHLISEKALTLEEKAKVEDTKKQLDKEIENLEKQLKQQPAVTPEPTTEQQPTGWRSYLPRPSFGGWFSRKPAEEPNIDIQRPGINYDEFIGIGTKPMAQQPEVTPEPTTEQQPTGWRSYLRAPSLGGWFSRKTQGSPTTEQ